MRFFVESYGCTMNYGEGDQLSEHMLSLGHKKVDSPEDADIVVLNTCTVVDTTEKKMIRRMSELRKAGKEVIVTGCMAKVQVNRVEIRLPGSLIIPPEEYTDFKDLVSERYGCSSVKHESDGSNIIPISQGCLGNCTYCITKFARGPLKSYDPKHLVRMFNKAIDDGHKEILITAQDTGCYGVDTDTDLPSLLRSMLEKKGEYRIRIGMMNPNSLRPILDDMMDVMKDPRIYRFLHLPIQSGSDVVLEAMNRPYKVNGVLEMVNKMRSIHPDISISTDLISGFPGETDDDHKQSVDLIKALKADTVNITRFSPRPGTEAASMKIVHGRISKERSAELTEMKNEVEYENNSKLVGKIMSALVTEIGKEGTVIVRSDNYRPIAIAADIPIGSFVEVKVTDCESTYLIGRMLNK